MTLSTTNAQKLHAERATMYATIQNRLSGYLDPNTNLIHSQYLEERSCPVCSQNQETFIFYKNGGRYVKCKSCSMLYLNPVFKDCELTKYYATNTTVQAQAHESESDFYRKIYTQGLLEIEQFTNVDTLLDIGCSSGFFLDCARERGWTTYGLELNTTEAKIARQKQHCIATSSLEQYQTQQKFNAICLWDVFEHIKNPKAMLNRLKQFLTPNGVLFIQVPNAQALAARIMREECNMFDGIEHVNLYNPSTLKRVLEQEDFHLQNLQTIIDELAVTQNYLNYDPPYTGQYEQQNLEFLTPELIHQHQLGYKIQAVARAQTN